ncbi:MAG: hypothetical protein MUC98_10575 [Desulfobacterota bacterium]|jgi:hypothetical protein|nr:hypothetical protein [Thermodesulfobacteriota bacterium]
MMGDSGIDRDRVQEVLVDEGRLGRLILSLHNDGATGTLGIREGKIDLTLYFETGLLVYAEGIDKEGPLLAELVSKGKIDLKQLDELRILSRNDPNGLGQALLSRKIVSEALWRKFVQIKATTTLSAAFDMERPDLLYSDSEPTLSYGNRLHEQGLAFVLDTIRGTKPHDALREILKTREMVFGFSSDSSCLRAGLPLNPFEEKTLSLINGRHTVHEIQKASGLTPRWFQKCLYCLIRLGLVDKAAQEKTVSREHTAIIRLYLNLLLMVAAAYRQEIGKRSEKIFKTCVAELPPPGKALLSDLDLVTGALERSVKKIGAHLMEQSTLSDKRLILLTCFGKLLYLLITRMKKLMGKKRAMKTVDEMIRALAHFDPGKKNSELMRHVAKNLEDLGRQVQR